MTRKMPRAKDSLRSIGVKPSKQRGQNFIIDPLVIEEIVRFGEPKHGQAIVEIGPGLGALTGELVKLGNSFSVIEIEEKFARDLSHQFPQIKVYRSDVRSFDFSQIGRDLLVFGNLPYSFSTEIVFHLLDQTPSINRAVVMLQREFAERVAAPPGSRTYGVLSVMTQLRADMRLGAVIAGTSFHPRANVESMLLELTLLPEPRYEVGDIKQFRRLVQGAFLQRRKKVRNSLRASGLFADQERLDWALQEAHIDPDARAEVLSVETFARLAQVSFGQQSKLVNDE